MPGASSCPLVQQVGQRRSTCGFGCCRAQRCRRQKQKAHHHAKMQKVARKKPRRHRYLGEKKRRPNEHEGHADDASPIALPDKQPKHPTHADGASRLVVDAQLAQACDCQPQQSSATQKNERKLPIVGCRRLRPRDTNREQRQSGTATDDGKQAMPRIQRIKTRKLQGAQKCGNREHSKRKPVANRRMLPRCQVRRAAKQQGVCNGKAKHGSWPLRDPALARAHPSCAIQ